MKTGSGMIEGSILALSVFAAQIHLSQRERLWQYGKAPGFAKGSPFGRAVTAGDGEGEDAIPPQQKSSPIGRAFERMRDRAGTA